MDAGAPNDNSSPPVTPTVHNAPNQSSPAASHPPAPLTSTADGRENTRRRSLHLDIDDADPDDSATASQTLLPSPPSSPSSSARSSTDDRQMGRTPPSDDPDAPRNGHANGNGHAANGKPSRNGRATGAMSGALLEQRQRKHASSARPPASRVVARESFSLDDDVPPLLSPAGAAAAAAEPRARGFSQLPLKDRRNFLLLVLLYFLQGLPMGLALGSLPLLLKQHVSYTQMGVFSLASYPYSLKLLWSPVVDALWSPVVGRRKSWILPIQTLSGLGMIWLAGHVDEMMVRAGDGGGAGVWGFTWWWFGLVFMCATQDIAVDGTFLPPSGGAD